MTRSVCAYLRTSKVQRLDNMFDVMQADTSKKSRGIPEFQPVQFSPEIDR